MSGERKRLQQRRVQSAARSRFLKVALVGSGAALVSATGLYWLYQRQISETTGRIPQGEEFPDILNNYPEAADLPVYDAGVIDTKFSTVNWYNFSEVSLDDTAAKFVYTGIHNFAQLAETQIRPYVIRGLEVGWSGEAYDKEFPNYKSQVFVIPDNAPKPFWASNSIGSTEIGLGDGGQNLSFINIVDRRGISNHFTNFQESYQLHINVRFAVEAAQNTFRIAVYSDINPGQSTLLDMQEIVGNSLGRAIALRQTGFDYQNYLTLAQNSTLEKPSTGELFPLVILDETEYNTLPNTPVLIP